MPDPAVDVRALSKTYRVHERAPGRKAALRSVLSRTYHNVRAVTDPACLL